MQKKIIVILLTITIIITIGVIAIKFYNTKNTSKPKSQPVSIDKIKDIPDQTGGVITPAVESDVREGEKINKMIRSLPISYPAFTISKYDYSKAIFIVDLNKQIASPEAEFDSWRLNSEYATLPNNLFYLK